MILSSMFLPSSDISVALHSLTTVFIYEHKPYDYITCQRPNLYCVVEYVTYLVGVIAHCNVSQVASLS